MKLADMFAYLAGHFIRGSEKTAEDYKRAMYCPYAFVRLNANG